MKLLTMTLMTSFLFTAPAFAEDAKTSSSESAVKAITGTEKKSRKKKVEMCGECGKPESECECHKDKKNGKDAKKSEHSSDTEKR